MPINSVQWNDATGVTEPGCLQRILPRPHRKYEPIDLVDKERRYQLDCNRFQIRIANVNYATATGMTELERRLQKHLNGTLRYEYMATAKLQSIASARDIDVTYDTAINEPGRIQLIQLIKDSDDAAGPFKLLQLPPELRAVIFGYVVLSEYETSYSPGPVLPDFPPLLFVNRQLRREAGEIFMQSRQIVLPCTVNVDASQESALETTDVKISAPQETLEWLRMAGLDLLPRIRSCLLVYRRVPELLYRSYVFDIDPAEEDGVYRTHLLGQIKGTPLLDNRGLYLLNLNASIQTQLNIEPRHASKIKLNETKASKIVESFLGLKEQTVEDMQCSKLYGGAILLNWL